MKFALCNEVFRELSIEDSFSKIAEIGYHGVEISPFTLQSNPLNLSNSDADRCRNAAQLSGLEIVGLHWLMAETRGLHLTHSDSNMRQAARDYLKKLVFLTSRMGGSIMVLGSPDQRNLEFGTMYQDAFDRAVEIISDVSISAEEYGVMIAIEPLSPVETSFLASSEEASRFIEEVNHPACRLHLDMKAMAHEPAGALATIYKHHSKLIHFHANDINHRGPGQGPTDLASVIAALNKIKYQKWISVEPFDYYPSPFECAQISLKNLKHCNIN